MEDKTLEYKNTLIDLLEQKQYTKLRQEVEDMNAADVAAVMDDMEDEESLKIFRILPKSRSRDSSILSSPCLKKRRPVSLIT